MVTNRGIRLAGSKARIAGSGPRRSTWARRSGTVQPHPDLSFYCTTICATEPLTALEEKHLGWKIINDGDEQAKDLMIRANLRLVVTISRDYAHRGMQLIDLIAEGNVGLIRAVEHFDPARGTRFSTHASWWINQAILQALFESRQTYHVPAYMIELIRRWTKASRRLEAEMKCPPTQDELATAIEVSPATAGRISRAMRGSRWPKSPGVAEEEPAPDIGDSLPDRMRERPEETADRVDQAGAITRVLDTLDRREALVVRLRYGLTGREPMTLGEIGDEIGVTRERVRQIERAVLSRIRKRLGVEVSEGARKRDPAA